MQAAAKATLVNLVEEHLTGLVKEASCVSRHAKRARMLGPHDVRRRITYQDINLALQWRGSEKIYQSSKGGGGGDVVDLNAYLQSEAQVDAPYEMGLTMHWLAVDGEQPDVIENPPRHGVVPPVTMPHPHLAQDAEESGEAIQVQQLLPRVLSEDLQLYYTRIIQAVDEQRGGGAASTSSTPAQRRAQDEALASLQRNAGLQELVPFFMQHLVSEIYSSMGHTQQSRTLVRMAKAMLANRHLHLELQLPQLLSALMTLILAKQLATHKYENEWALRTEASQALLQACNIFGPKYTTLKARVLKTLVESISPTKPLGTLFGAITAVSLFGPKAIDAFLLPMASTYYEQWNLVQEVDVEGIPHVQQALVDAIAVYLQNVHSSEIAQRLDGNFVDVFGEVLVPMYREPTDYTMCVV